MIGAQNIKNNGFSSLVMGLFWIMMGTFGRSVTGMDEMLIACGLLSWYNLIKGFIALPFYERANYLPFGYRLYFYLYLLVVLIMLVRGYTISYRFQWDSMMSLIRFHLLDQTYILPYLMPLVLFVPYRYYRFDKIVKLTKWISLITVFSFIVFLPQIIQSSQNAMMGLYTNDNLVDGTDIVFYGKFCFIALCWKYVPTNIWRYNLLGLIVCFICLMIAARRGSSLTYLIILLYLAYEYSKHHGSMTKIIILMIGGGLMLFVLKSDVFFYIFERGMEDTRSYVQGEMLSQMSRADMIFGKGLNGRYYCPLGVDNYLNGWRYGIETGFYNIVLKGGYLMAFMYIGLLLKPALCGIFKSQNQLCKVGGFYILLSLWELYPFGWLTFDIKFLIIWMMVVLCMNPSIRRMTDEQIKYQFFR